MNKEDLIKKYCKQLKKLQISTDTECAHVDADDLLCELLNRLGFEEVVEAFNDIDKWYA
jgi:hypothetical protein